MNIILKLKDWRAKKAQEENVELYLVMQNKTIEEIVENMPINKDDFLAIKGLGEKKYDKYGKDILYIVNSEKKIDDSFESDNDGIYSVSKFLDLINSKFASIEAKVKGEISSVDIRSTYLFFTIKDEGDSSSMSCFMWSSDYKLCGVDLEIGMEIIVHGKPDIYKPSGRFSLRADTVELVGEGALKKAYDELKKKLALEGVFDEAKKREIPALPSKIGLITSKEGAVIHDFGNNLGNFGFNTIFYNSRVEGILAVKQLSEGIKYFRDKDIDVLVIIRGGGSMESLQAFNNETLVREIVDYPVPVICGIGHDKDVPLFSLAADRSESTPSMVARVLNKTWEQAIDKINYYESNIVNKYFVELQNKQIQLQNYYHSFADQYNFITRRVKDFDQIIIDLINNIYYGIKNSRAKILQSKTSLLNNFSKTITDSEVKTTSSMRLLQQNDPGRQLKLGYSIIFSGDRVVKSVHQVKNNGVLRSRLSDGEVLSTINEIRTKEIEDGKD